MTNQHVTLGGGEALRALEADQRERDWREFIKRAALSLLHAQIASGTVGAPDDLARQAVVRAVALGEALAPVLLDDDDRSDRR